MTSRSPSRRKVDRREVVTPPIFDINGKITLKEHMVIFEEYFDKKYRGNSYDKTQKLGDFLSGELKEIFEIRGGRTVRFDEMKDHLLQHHKKQKIGGKQYWRRQMAEAEVKSNEGYDMLGLRLMEMAERAYPSDQKECAARLREHYLRLIPQTVVRKIEDTERALKASSGGKKRRMPFSGIMEVAREVQKKLQKSEKTVMLADQSEEYEKYRSQSEMAAGKMHGVWV